MFNNYTCAQNRENEWGHLVGSVLKKVHDLKFNIKLT